MRADKGKVLSPVFITGIWRSGTTLISRIMNNHKDIEVTYDTVHFLRFSKDRYDPIDNAENARKLIVDTAQRLQERYGLSFPIEKTIEELGGTYSYASIYNSIMNNFLLKGSNKPVWGEKTNLAWSKIPDFLNMFPDGRVIHMIRDPRAVLSSWKKFTYSPGNDYLDSIFNSFDSMEMALKYDKKYSDKRYITVRYEDLVSSPDITVRQICDKFRIDYDKDMLDAGLFTNFKGGQWKGKSSHGDNIDGISIIAIERWKVELQEWEIFLTDNIFDELYNAYGYQSEAVINSNKLIDTAVSELQKSSLATNGFLQCILGKKGVERYPSDPLKSENWENET